MYDENYLANRLRKASLGRDEATFARFPDGRELSYGQLFEAAERNAGALQACGVVPGDRVAVQADKSVEMLELYLGTILAGGVFLPLNTGYTAAEVSYFLGDAKPSVFVCDPAKRDALTSVAAAAGVENLLTLAADGSGVLADLVRSQPSRCEVVARAADDLAAILYTSGTTGRSKGAMLSHANLASNAETLVDLWHFTADDVLIHALPIYHTHGLFVATNVTLVAGGALHFLKGFDADAIIAAMPHSTALMGVPTFYTRLLDHPGLNRETAKNMRLFISGSAPLLAETHKQWRERTGHAILERYGMTEINMGVSNPYDGERRAGTVGFPLPDVALRIVDPETGKPLPADEIGMIEVKGPNVFRGYWQMPEKTREEFRDDGFFMTGDLAVRDGDGYISIVGRSKDLVISGGFNVYPKEIEALIDDIPGVKESAVIGLPHSDFGEAVAAAVVVEDGAAVTKDDVMGALADRLARFKQPKAVFFVDELPRNTMGKVQKNVLREAYKDTFA